MLVSKDSKVKKEGFADQFIAEARDDGIGVG